MVSAGSVGEGWTRSPDFGAPRDRGDFVVTPPEWCVAYASLYWPNGRLAEGEFDESRWWLAWLIDRRVSDLEVRDRRLERARRRAMARRRA